MEDGWGVFAAAAFELEFGAAGAGGVAGHRRLRHGRGFRLWRLRSASFGGQGRGRKWRPDSGFGGFALLRWAACARRATAAKWSYGGQGRALLRSPSFGGQGRGGKVVEGWGKGGDGTGLDELEGGLDGAEAEFGGEGGVGEEGFEGGAGEGGEAGGGSRDDGGPGRRGRTGSRGRG